MAQRLQIGIQIYIVVRRNVEQPGACGCLVRAAEWMPPRINSATLDAAFLLPITRDLVASSLALRPLAPRAFSITLDILKILDDLLELRPTLARR